MASKEKVGFEDLILSLARDSKGNYNLFINVLEVIFEDNTTNSGDLQKADFFLGVGNLLHQHSFHQPALLAWMKALSFYNKLDDDRALRGISRCYTSFGILHDSLGRYEDALKYHKKALDIVKGLCDPKAESACYINIGVTYSSLSKYDKVMEYHEKALLICKDIGDKGGEALCYANIANANNSLGNYELTVEYHKKAFAIYDEIGDKRGKGSFYGVIGLIHHSLGRYQDAIESQEKALALYDEIGDKRGQHSCHTNLGIVYQSLGQKKIALECHEKALFIARETGDLGAESVSYGHIGVAYGSLGEYNKVIEYQEKALVIAEKIGARGSIAHCYSAIGLALNSLGQSEKAIEYYHKALMIANETGVRASEASLYAHIGEAYHSLKQYNRAIESQEKALAIFDEIGDNGGKAYSLELSGYAYESQKLYADATKFLKLSIEISESIGYDIKQHEHKSTFYGLSSNKYKVLVKTLLNQNNQETAFEYVERGKAQALRDLISATRLEIKGEGKALNVHQIQKMVPPKAVVIEYFVLSDELLIFVINSDVFDVVQVPISRKAVEDYLTSYELEVVNYAKFPNMPQSWLGLNEHLIEPVKQYINNSDMVIFVPNDFLHYFPLHALHLDGEPLIRKHPVVYSTSASFLQFHQNKQSRRIGSSLAVSATDPRDNDKLKRLIRTEANEIAGIVQAQLVADAPKRNTISLLNVAWEIVHLSCHGFFDMNEPLSSGIVFHPPDGRISRERDILTAREIFGLTLGSNLITLSACETGLNRIGAGDNILGFTYSFIHAGASSVLASLWRVDAGSTKDLMVEFYRQLKGQNNENMPVNKAVALQRAMIKVMNEVDDHTYRWAGFILVGDWE